MKTIRRTRSVCPVCLRPLEAELRKSGAAIELFKGCPEHGAFSVPVWRGLIDFNRWRGSAPEMSAGEGLSCPYSCGICSEHQQGSCCVLLEVTRRCNLNCRFCFAGEGAPEPGMEELKAAVDAITEKSKPLIQLSGGEPSLRDDLPELIRYIKERGVRYVQLNSNGLRLAEDEAYVKAISEAGLNFVFLQFDGVDDEVYVKLRGKALLDIKKRAITLCGKYGLGVTLVPTLVQGVNDEQVGEIIRFGASLSPVVRGVHFQPVSYFGRYPAMPENSERYTLDELIHALAVQAGIKEENIAPSRCDHPGCGFHSSFIVASDGSLSPLTVRREAGGFSSHVRNREYIGGRWSRDLAAEAEGCGCGLDKLEDFVRRLKSHGFTVTAMAFQDALNLDIERLRQCSLHVWCGDRLKPFCAAYLTAQEVE